MRFAGKCLPEPDDLADAADRGFDTAELYLRKEHLDRFDDTLADIRYGPVEIVTVHTPHVHLSERDYLKQANALAQELNAYTVVHSGHILNIYTPRIEELGLDQPYGYENNPISTFHMEQMILKPGLDLVLDTAHLFVAEEHYLEKLRYILQTYPDQVNVIHISDATRQKDGLPFGEGDMDMQATSQIIAESGFEGTLVFEVMPDYQATARDFFIEYAPSLH